MFDRLFNIIKEKSRLLYFVLLFGFFCFISVKFWSVTTLTGETLFLSLLALLPHWGSIAFLLILFFGVRYLFKLSDKKAQERIDEYDKPLICESERKKYISVKLTEAYGKIDDEDGEILKAVIKNETDKDIDYLKGSIYLYKHLERISKIDFEFSHLGRLCSERVFYGFVDHEKLFWNGFDVYISEIKMEGVNEKDLLLEGNHFYRTHFFELNLNQFYDFRIMGIRTRYNLVWLKKKIRREIWPRIRHFYSKRRIYFYPRPFYLELKDAIPRYLRFVLVILIALIIVLFGIILLIDIGTAILNLFQVWKVYFQQAVKIIG